MKRIILFAILYFSVVHLTAQDLQADRIIIQDITYVNGGTQTKKGPQFRSFFENQDQLHTLVKRIQQDVNRRWNIRVDTTITPTISAKFPFLYNPQQRIKSQLPANPAAGTAYLSLFIFSTSTGATFPPRMDNWIFQYQLRMGDLLIEDLQSVRLSELSHPDDCMAILEKGLTYLFDYETNLRRKYPKFLTAEKKNVLVAAFPQFHKSDMVINSHFLSLDKNGKEEWYTTKGKNKIYYTRQNIGGDIASGVVTTLLNVGTSTEKDFLLEQKVEVASHQDERYTCIFRMAGTERKEKERVKENNSYRAESQVSTTTRLDALTKGEWLNEDGIIATFQFVDDSTLLPFFRKGKALDSVIHFPAVETADFNFQQRKSRKEVYAVRGHWKEVPFTILYQSSNEVIQFFWRDELVAFSLQGEYEPALYTHSNTEAPVQQMALIQLILSRYLFQHLPFQ